MLSCFLNVSNLNIMFLDIHHICDVFMDMYHWIRMFFWKFLMFIPCFWTFTIVLWCFLDLYHQNTMFSKHEPWYYHAFGHVPYIHSIYIYIFWTFPMSIPCYWTCTRVLSLFFFVLHTPFNRCVFLTLEIPYFWTCIKVLCCFFGHIPLEYHVFEHLPW